MKNPSHGSKPKIAIVHDWLTNMGGAEKVVLAFHDAFPDAPIFTSTYNPNKTPAFDGLDVRTTYLQKLPSILRHLHKFLPILRVYAFRRLDLHDYDVILSSSGAEAKQARKTRPGQIHISYCHTPIRYYWSHYQEYVKDPGFGKLNWLIRLIMPLVVPALKKSDFKAAQQVDYFIANSTAVQQRIEKYYKRQSTVIFPPVDTSRFSPHPQRDDFYVALARHIPYKRLDLAIAAAKELDLRLRVFGDGSEHDKLVSMAGPTVSFYSGAPDKKSQDFIVESFNSARGYIFPAEEDFGISQVEAMAGGAPVIAYGKGGSRDIVQDGKTGVFFDRQTLDAVVQAVQTAESTTFSPEFIHEQAKRFDKKHFVANIRAFVTNHTTTPNGKRTQNTVQ